MAYKTILACLTNETKAQQLSRAGAVLAEKHGAHLIGAHTLQSMMIYPGVSVHIPDSVISSFYAEQKRQSDAIHAIFESETKGRAFVAEWREMPASGEASNAIVEQARCADLVVMGQNDPDQDRADQRGMVRAVIEDSGRPVLVIPKDGEFEAFGASAVIGWSATREATRALHDAIPLLENGGTATIVSATHSQDHADEMSKSANQVAALLSRYDVDASVSILDADRGATAEVLTQVAFEAGADMIVTGAFGHSRFYDFAIGATSTALLEGSTIPVLFSR